VREGGSRTALLHAACMASPGHPLAGSPMLTPLLSLLLSQVPTAPAATAQPPPPLVEVHGEVRARAEVLGELDLEPARHTPALDGEQVLLRTRLSVAARPTRTLTLFVQPQDSRSFGDEPTTASAVNGIDLHQGYLEAREVAGLPLMVRVGRMELSYGDQRLVGAFGWNNVGRAFDAALVRVGGGSGAGSSGALAGFTVDVFWSRLRAEPRGAFGRAVGDDFAGLYASFSRGGAAAPTALTVDAYVLGLYDRGGTQDSNGDGAPEATRFPGGGELRLYTPGVRADLKLLRALHLNAEAAYQLGTRGQQDVHAWALHASADYTFAVPTQPRVLLGYDRASGDESPTDDTWGTFENLFPTNHDKYGLIDLASWKNLSDAYAGVSCKPWAPLEVAATVHLLARAESGDTFYRASGAPLRDRAAVLARGVEARGVGTELDLSATWKAAPGLGLLLGYSKLWSGSFLEQTAAAGTQAPSPSFGYLQLTGSL